MNLLELILKLFPECSVHGDRIVPCPVCGSKQSRPCTYYEDTNSVFCFDSGCDLNSRPYRAADFLLLTGRVLDAFDLEAGDLTSSLTSKSRPGTGQKVLPVGRPVFREIYQVTAQILHRNLLASNPESRQALEYQLVNRGHKLQTLQRFQVGYISDSIDLRRMLLSLGERTGRWNEDDVNTCGLFHESKWDSRWCFLTNTPMYVYPIKWRGQTCSLKLKPPKLSGVVSNFPIRVPQSATGNDFPFVLGDITQDEIILVEGENDFLSMFENGYENVVCTSGTPGWSQIGHLRPDQSLIFAFDHDESGRGDVQLFRRRGFDGETFSYPEEFKDPDDWLQSTRLSAPKIR